MYAKLHICIIISCVEIATYSDSLEDFICEGKYLFGCDNSPYTLERIYILCLELRERITGTSKAEKYRDERAEIDKMISVMFKYLELTPQIIRVIYEYARSVAYSKLIGVCYLWNPMMLMYQEDVDILCDNFSRHAYCEFRHVWENFTDADRMRVIETFTRGGTAFKAVNNNLEGMFRTCVARGIRSIAEIYMSK